MSDQTYLYTIRLYRPEALMKKDPAVAEGLMRGEIHPFRASVVGKF